MSLPCPIWTFYCQEFAKIVPRFAKKMPRKCQETSRRLKVPFGPSLCEVPTAILYLKTEYCPKTELAGVYCPRSLLECSSSLPLIHFKRYSGAIRVCRSGAGDVACLCCC